MTLFIRWFLEQGVWLAPVLAAVLLSQWQPERHQRRVVGALVGVLAAISAWGLTLPATVQCRFINGWPVCTEWTVESELRAGSILPAPMAEPMWGSATEEVETPAMRRAGDCLAEVPVGAERQAPAPAGPYGSGA